VVLRAYYRNLLSCGMASPYAQSFLCAFLSVFVEAQEELAAWQEHWDRHLDILQQQEAALFERLCTMGYDPRPLCSEYDASDEALAAQFTPAEKEAWRQAEAELALAVTTPIKRRLSGSALGMGDSANESKEQDNSDAEAAMATTSAPRKRKPRKPSHNAVVWTEEVVEEDTEGRLPEYEETAKTDPIVLQYAPLGGEYNFSSNNGSSGGGSGEQYPVMDPARYPASFAAVTPRSVIHAFIHAT
jgi:hypothetical protein